MTNLLTSFYSEPWAITEAKHAEIESVLHRWSNDALPQSPEEIERAIADSSHVSPESVTGLSDFDRVTSGQFLRRGGTAYIPLHGSIISRAGMVQKMSGATSPQAFEAKVRAAAGDEDIDRIILDIDSPGGTVAGTAAAAGAVREAASSKEVIAVGENMIASAAYWIASGADRIIVNETARIGSIGVIIAHTDMTAKLEEQGYSRTIVRQQGDKALGRSDEPLTDDALAALEGIVSDSYESFVKAVAASRGMSEDVIANEIGSRTYSGADAVQNGLADEIGSLAAILSDNPETTTSSMDNAEEMQAEIDRLRGEVEASREEAQKAQKQTEEALELARQQGEALAQHQTAQVEDKAREVVSGIIGAGKATPAQKEELLSKCKVDGTFDADAIAFVDSMYASIPKNAAVPIGGSDNGGAGRDNDGTDATSRSIDKQLASGVPDRYRDHLD